MIFPEYYSYWNITVPVAKKTNSFSLTDTDKYASYSVYMSVLSGEMMMSLHL